MLLAARGLLLVILIAFWVFCLIDAITTPPEKVRNLPKAAWVIIVIVLFEIGGLAWLIAGRERGSRPASRGVSGNRIHPMASNPDDDEDFMRLVRERAEEQRRRAREAGTPPEEQPPATT